MAALGPLCSACAKVQKQHSFRVLPKSSSSRGAAVYLPCSPLPFLAMCAVWSFFSSLSLLVFRTICPKLRLWKPSPACSRNMNDDAVQRGWWGHSACILGKSHPRRQVATPLRLCVYVGASRIVGGAMPAMQPAVPSVCFVNTHTEPKRWGGKARRMCEAEREVGQ